MAESQTHTFGRILRWHQFKPHPGMAKHVIGVGVYVQIDGSEIPHSCMEPTVLQSFPPNSSRFKSCAKGNTWTVGQLTPKINLAADCLWEPRRAALCRRGWLSWDTGWLPKPYVTCRFGAPPARALRRADGDPCQWGRHHCGGVASEPHRLDERPRQKSGTVAEQRGCREKREAKIVVLWPNIAAYSYWCEAASHGLGHIYMGRDSGVPPIQQSRTASASAGKFIRRAKEVIYLTPVSLLFVITSWKSMNVILSLFMWSLVYACDT